MFDLPESPAPFSKRYGLAPAPEVRVTHAAPPEVRVAILDEAVKLQVGAKRIREIVCTVLRQSPDDQNWSDDNVLGEIRQMLRDCDWYRVYDVAEAMASALPYTARDPFKSAINDAFVDEGVGWRFDDNSLLVIRSDAAFETARIEASRLLAESGRSTARTRIDSALVDLSKRPDPNCSDAVYHAASALEALARDLIGDVNLTLGELLKRHPTLVPEPLNTALQKIWGFASDRARHAAEGKGPSFNEAELAVGLCSQVVVYLERQSRRQQRT